MSRIFDDVEGRHSGSAEAVHKQCLEFTLTEVNYDERKRQGLEIGGFGS